MASAQPVRYTPELSFLATVALRFEAPRSMGDTPDGVRFHFTVQGTVEGPRLKGNFPPCAAYLLVDREGIGTINVRAPLVLQDGALAELEATGRYDFGADGHRRAAAGDLPNSALGWCPRLTTGNPNYLWLNRSLQVGVGELRPREARVDYDMFIVNVGAGSGSKGNFSVGNLSSKAAACPPGAAASPSSSAYPSSGYPPAMPQGSYKAPLDAPSIPKSSYKTPLHAPSMPPSIPEGSYKTPLDAPSTPPSIARSSYEAPLDAPSANIAQDKASLYERLGAQPGIDGIARDFVDALLGNVNLNRQNRKVAVAHSTVRGEKKRSAVQLASDMFCKLTGGPCEHRLTRPLRDTHIHLDITESDWSLMRVDLERVLTKHHVAKAEREELMAIVEGTRAEIVK